MRRGCYGTGEQWDRGIQLQYKDSANKLSYHNISDNAALKNTEKERKKLVLKIASNNRMPPDQG